jgi:hypothetical protein
MKTTIFFTLSVSSVIVAFNKGTHVTNTTSHNTSLLKGYYLLF